MTSRRVSILIVAYRSAPHLPRLFDALDAQSFTDFETILIDNASPEDAVSDDIAARATTFVRNDANTGFAAATNQAADLARGELLALLNPDAFPEPGWLDALVAAADAHPDVAAFGSTQLLDADPARLDGAGDVLSAFGVPWRGGHGRKAPKTLEDGEPFSVCAAAALWRAERWRALGGLEPAFFAYCEDVDLGFRHRLSGGRCRQVAGAVVRHVGGASEGMRSDFAVELGARNRLWLFERCMPAPLYGLLWLPMAFATLMLWVQAMYRGQVISYGQGVLAAIVSARRMKAARAVIQAGRTASTGEIAAALAWSPLKLLTRAIVLRRS